MAGSNPPEIEAAERADWNMLRASFGPRNVFSIPHLNPILGAGADAFNRGVDLDWFTLVDVQHTGRLFKLTAAGMARRSLLKEKYAETEK